VSGHTITFSGRELKVTNPDKVLYPEAGFTKGDVIEYYRRIAPALLPHLRGRALTMKRYPNGVDEEYFYQKESPKHRPEWVTTVPIWSEGNGRDINFTVVNSLPTLLWAANLADLELHTSLARAKTPRRPTMMVFDLDPGPPATIVECCEVALMLRERLGKAGLEIFPKTSGSKGLQVYAPLNTAVGYDGTKGFARDLARAMEAEHPDLVVSNMRKELRTGRVLMDWSQNDYRKTTVCVYSLRARAHPTVSTPLAWEEVEQTAKRGDPELLVFERAAVLDRVERLGDLFEPVVKLRQKLPFG
jgi:bifunctional non-homologous end joining protein LigD